MEVGIELDAKVAKEIFDEPWPINELHFRDTGNGWLALVPKSAPASPEANRRINDVLPKFSADMTAAWQVVERLMDRFHFFVGRMGSFAAPNPGWSCEFSGEWKTGEPQRERYEALAETTPHAICLAALKAVAALQEGWSGERFT